MTATVESRLTELELAVTNLESVVNLARFMSERMSEEDWQAAKATSLTLPSGDRNVYDNLRELRIDWAEVHSTIDGLKAEIAALKASPAPSGDVVVGDDAAAAVLAVLQANGIHLADGMIGFGGIDPESAATFQVFGNKYVGDASIQFTTANGNVATISLSGDGGLRDLNNQRVTKEERQGYDPDGNVYFPDHLEVVDPNKHHSQIGTDSRHNPSWKRVLPANATKPDGSAYEPHEYTQDVVLEINEDEKELRWASYRRGWHWAFTDNAKYGPVRIWRALMEVLG